MSKTPLLLIYTCDSGDGHNTSAMAIKLAASGFRVEIVNPIKEIIPQLGFLFGLDLENLYNMCMKSMIGRLLINLSSNIINFITKWRLLYNKNFIYRKLNNFYKEKKPSYILSVNPHSNDIVFRHLYDNFIDIGFSVVITDIDTSHYNFWFQNQNIHYFLGSKQLVNRANRYNYKNYTEISGMVIRQEFLNYHHLNKDILRQQFGFNIDEIILLIICSGQEVSDMVKISKLLSDKQIIFMIGKNNKMKDQLSKIISKKLHLIVPYTNEIMKYMFISDLFLGKPGPGTVSEVLSLGIPVFLWSNWNTLIQEKYVAEYVYKEKYGLIINQINDTKKIIDANIDKLPFFRKNIQDSYKNKAVIEVIDEIRQKIKI